MWQVLGTILNYVYLALLVSAFSLIQCLIGGTRLLFSFPSYCILGVCGILTLFSAFRSSEPRQSASNRQSGSDRPDGWCILASLLFFSYILVRAKLSPIDYFARPDFYMVLGCLLVYLLTAFYLTSARDRLIVIASLFCLAVLHVYVGTIQFMHSSGYMWFGFVRVDTTPRASGLYICSDHMAGFLEAIAVIGLSLAWWSRWPVWGKILIGYLSLGCYFGVAISVSRGGMLSSIFSLLVFSVLGLSVIRKIDRDKFGRALVVWGVIAMIGAGGASFLALRSQLIRSRINQQHTADVRIYNWQATLDQVRTAPLLGTGAGTHLYYGRLFRRPQLQADPVHSHCDYLELLAEYGVVGALGMALFLAAHLFSGFRSLNFLIQRLRNSYVPRSNALALQIGTLCAVFGLMAHSVVDFNMHIPANALVFAFLFGILTNPGVARQTEERPEPGWFALDRWISLVRFALPVLGVGICLLAVPRYPGEYFAEQSRVALRDKRYMDCISLGKRALGEAFDETFWLDRLNKRMGGEKQNPYLQFYIGEANRGIGMRMSNRILRKTYLMASVAAYKKSLEIFPQDENTLVRLGQSYDRMDQYPEAEEAFTKAIQCDPNLAILYSYYADHLKLQGLDEDVEKSSAKAKELAKKNIVELGTTDLMSK